MMEAALGAKSNKLLRNLSRAASMPLTAPSQENASGDEGEVASVVVGDEPEQYVISEPAITPEQLRHTGGDMRTLIAGSIALIAVLAAGGVCSAQVVVKKEPMEGQLRTGATVLVDDGTCGQGKIKLITATGGNGNEIVGLPPRSRTCVPRQAALR
jgi:hypothetical protein